ncbi:unnamed protein product [Schistosoma turkestanicum]|nr:unnamed protein product [Schistosoma turkestanicum]
MHNERRGLRPDLEARIADTIRVVACKQNQDLRITFANDYACSDRSKPTGSKVVHSASGSGLQEAYGHKMQHQSVSTTHKGPRLNRHYGNDGTFISPTIDSHIPTSYGSANRRPPITKSEFDYRNNRRSIHGIHSINKDQEQYNRDLMTQYEINRALFLANPPPSVLASRNRARTNDNKVNDNRRIDIQNNSFKQPILNGSRTDRSAVFRPPFDQQRDKFLSKSMKERTFHNSKPGYDSRGALSTNSRGFTRHPRGLSHNNFHRGQSSKQYWGHDDRFENHENTAGIRVQNSFRNGDSKTRQHSGDEYIDDLTPEDIAKYKLEINMDKQPRFVHHQHHHYNLQNNRYHSHHHSQLQQQKYQKNHSNAYDTQLYHSSRKEPIRSNNKIRGSYSNHTVNQYQMDEKGKPRNFTNGAKIPVNEMNISAANQVNTDEPIQSNDPTEDSQYFELDYTSGIFDIQSHERARSFLTLGIDDSELSQNDCYANISESSMHEMHRSYSLPSLRELEKNFQPHSFRDCTTPTINLNTDGIANLSTEINAVTTSVELNSENSTNVSSANVCSSDVTQKSININNESNDLAKM